MKKFKPNVMATGLYSFLEMAPGLMIGILILFSFIFSVDGDYEFFKLIIPLLVIGFPFEIILIFSIFTLITLPFVKYYVFLYDEFFVHNNITVNYRDVDRIEIDSGVTSRYGGGTPCSLKIFIDGELVTSIQKVPFILTFILLKRCRYAAKKHIKLKGAIIMNVIIIAVMLGLGIFAASQTVNQA